MKTRIFAALAALLLFTSCESLPTDSRELISWKYVRNGCMIDAANYQAALEAKENIYPTLWARVVIFEFRIGDTVHGHAMCVYETPSHAVWIWDRNGSMRVRGDKNDPKTCASAVMPNVLWAAWDDEF